MKTEILFTVVIPAFNVGAYLRGTISSILKQTLDCFEVIVVDDGSTDNSLEIATEFSKEDERVRVISQINQGVGAARNLGLRHALGKYVVFLDGDDWLADDALQTFAKSFDNESDAIFCNRIRHVEKSKLNSEENTFTQFSSGGVRPGRGLLRRFAVTGKSFNVKFLRDNSILFPVGMIWEDYVFSYQVLARARRVDVRTEKVYCYRIRSQLQPSLTQQNRFSPFGLQSRFRQIDDCQAIVNSSRLREIFNNYNFVDHDYGYRLTRDLRHLPSGRLEAEHYSALESYAEFLRNREPVWRQFVASETAKLFDLIVSGDFPMVSNMLRSMK